MIRPYNSEIEKKKNPHWPKGMKKIILEKKKT